MKTTLSLLLIGLLLVACNLKEDNKEPTSVSDTTTVDTTIVEVDTLSDDTLEAQGYDVKEDEKIEENLEKKYGEQWEFCDCVVRNDSINKALEQDLTDAQMDKLMARWDIVDKHCKKMLTAPNTTPAERNAHKRKVSKCMRQNGLK